MIGPLGHAQVSEGIPHEQQVLTVTDVVEIIAGVNCILILVEGVDDLLSDKANHFILTSWRWDYVLWFRKVK